MPPRTRSTARSPRSTCDAGSSHWPTGTTHCAFGRIDQDGERWYVGRRHVEDDDGDAARRRLAGAGVGPVLPGDRARPARAATAGAGSSPRVASCWTSSRRTSPTPTGRCCRGGIPDPLLAELERERTGSMRDIVATIAAEQDEVIRAPLDRLLVVQGGPGPARRRWRCTAPPTCSSSTGCELLERGVLVVGPNPAVPPLRRRRAAEPRRDRGPPDHRRGPPTGCDPPRRGGCGAGRGRTDQGRRPDGGR